ncbi:MAG: respiratory nitrate reductase subunit gamma, partial [Candidatus Syntrophosphaera sp.]
MTIAFFSFHMGAVAVPLFLAGHNVVLKQKLGFSFPVMGTALADFLSWAAIAGLLFLVLRRLVLPEVRILTDKKDWGILLLTFLPFATGLAARYQTGDYGFWLIAHILTGELLLFA